MSNYIITKTFDKFMCINHKYVVFGIGLGKHTGYYYSNDVDLACKQLEHLKQSILTKCMIGYVYLFFGKQFADVVDVYSPIYPINYIKAYKIDFDADEVIKEIKKC